MGFLPACAQGCTQSPRKQGVTQARVGENSKPLPFTAWNAYLTSDLLILSFSRFLPLYQVMSETPGLVTHWLPKIVGWQRQHRNSAHLEIAWSRREALGSWGLFLINCSGMHLLSVPCNGWQKQSSIVFLQFSDALFKDVWRANGHESERMKLKNSSVSSTVRPAPLSGETSLGGKDG